MLKCPNCGKEGIDQFTLISRGEEIEYHILNEKPNELVVVESGGNMDRTEYVLICKCGTELPWSGEITFR
jgi:hypothetical protein